jgi:transposase
MIKKRRQYTSEQKCKAVRRHLIDDEPISSICEELGIQVNLFYKWKKVYLDEGHRVFDNQPKSHHKNSKEAQLQERLKQRDGVINELIRELVIAKKNIGEI